MSIVDNIFKWQLAFVDIGNTCSFRHVEEHRLVALHHAGTTCLVADFGLSCSLHSVKLYLLRQWQSHNHPRPELVVAVVVVSVSVTK